MKSVLHALAFFAAGTLFVGSSAGSTAAYWRFEGDGLNVPETGSLVAHTAARTTTNPQGGVVVVDVSGNGNTLYGWDGSGNGALFYTDAVASDWTGSGGTSNRLSIVNGGSTPRAFTWGTQSLPAGVNLDTWQPLEWTIEASVYLDPSGASGWRTFIGRDGYQVRPGEDGLACLYFQKTDSGFLRLRFVDGAGNVHDALDPESFQAGRWYHLAAMSDGAELRLYRWDTVVDFGYRLVASTDLSGSPDPRLVADTISSTTLPLDEAGDPMNWSLGSGMYNSGGRPESGHADRWLGMIDEVRVSDEALSPKELLFAVPLVITGSGMASNGPGDDRLWMQWNSAAGAQYRVTSTTNLAAQTWHPQAVGLEATPPVNFWTSTVQTAEHAFYRVETEQAPMILDLYPNQALNSIDENIYGHFLEHIYHSANGGLWGELVWNRSLDTWPDEITAWSIEGDELVQSSLATDVRLTFGDTAWADYEFSLQARKDGGDEGFLILFRSDGGDFYWLNLGGWGNTRHQLEKGQGNPVGPQVSGTIATGQWYDIRVRCEGSQIQCWLNNTLIIDWTDTSGAHLTGEVGVGTWATQARYRNLLVQNLSGGTLYSGLPDLGAADYLPDHWTSYGQVEVNPSMDAANSFYSAQIAKTNSGEGGLMQTPFRFDGQSYSGSFWAKGSGPTGMVVRLKDGNTVLAQAGFSGPSGSWTKYPFQLTPSAAALDGTLEIGFAGTGTVYLDQVSLMGQDAIDTGGYRPDLLAAVDDLRPPVIRWPGGCFASLYLWKDAIGPQDERRIYPAYMWEDQDINSFGTDEFIRMCERTGTEPLLVMNTGILDSSCGAPAQFKLDSPEDYLPYALDWMEYCNGDTNTTWGAVRAANGHPEPYNVTYWEIDNETWCESCGGGIVNYIAAVNEFAPAMRARAAELGVPIKLSAVGSGGYDQSWNQDILDACATNIDYISVHWYADPSEWASGPLNYENYLIDLSNRIAASANPTVEIYNSEWNAQSIDLRTGLFAGGLLNVYERQGGVFTLGGPALFLRHTSAGGWNNAFINFDHAGWFPAPNYIVMKLWRDHYAPTRILVEGNSGSLNLIATKSDDGGTLFVKVVNPSATPARTYLRLPEGSAIGHADFQFVTAPALTTQNSMTNPDAVHVEDGSATVIGSIVDVTLPAYSASVVSISLE